MGNTYWQHGNYQEITYEEMLQKIVQMKKRDPDGSWVIVGEEGEKVKAYIAERDNRENTD